VILPGPVCIASTGANLFSGTAVSMTMYPIIPDFERYSDIGKILRMVRKH
jgi:sulfide:quinone oxidoreductase